MALRPRLSPGCLFVADVAVGAARLTQRYIPRQWGQNRSRLEIRHAHSHIRPPAEGRADPAYGWATPVQ